MNIQDPFTFRTPTASESLRTSDGIHSPLNEPEHTLQTPPRHGGSGFIVTIEADLGDSISCSRMSPVQNPAEAVIPAGTNRALKEKTGFAPQL